MSGSRVLKSVGQLITVVTLGLVVARAGAEDRDVNMPWPSAGYAINPPRHCVWYGRNRTLIGFEGDALAWPVLKIDGAHHSLCTDVIHLGRAVYIRWIDRWPKKVKIGGLRADAIGLEDDKIVVFERGDDGTWTRRTIEALHLRHVSRAQALSQLVTVLPVALAAPAAPVDGPLPLMVAGLAGMVSVAACSAYLAGGWQTHVEYGPVELTPAPEFAPSPIQR